MYVTVRAAVNQLGLASVAFCARDDAAKPELIDTCIVRRITHEFTFAGSRCTSEIVWTKTGPPTAHTFASILQTRTLPENFCRPIATFSLSTPCLKKTVPLLFL